MDVQKVYEENKNSVYRLALTYLHSIAEAEDVCHDVFLKMIEKQSSVYSGKERNWLLTVTANECKNRLKSRRTVELTEQSGSIPLMDHKLDVFDAVMKLGVRERTAVYLYYYEGYSAVEISHILKISPSAVRSRLERARIHLKRELEGD